MALSWNKMQTARNSQEKGCSISSAQSRGPLKSKAAFTGMMEAQEVKAKIGKYLEENWGICRQ